MLSFCISTHAKSLEANINYTPIYIHKCCFDVTDSKFDYILLRDEYNQYVHNYKYYGDYIVFSNESNSLNYLIYDYKFDRTIPLEQALEEKVCCIDKVFNEFSLGKLVGDINSDGELSILDASHIQRYLAKFDDFPIEDTIITDDNSNVYISDFNRDSYRSILDVSAIQRRLAKYSSTTDNLYFDSAFVIICFDSFNLTDKRFDIVKNEYNFNATVAYTKDYATNMTVLNSGWDIGLYKFNNYPPEIFGYEIATSETPSKEVLEAWDNYVALALSEANTYGVYNPTVWLTRQGCSCFGLEEALKNHKIKMCRGNYTPDYRNDREYNPYKPPTLTVSPKNTLTPSTLRKSIIDIDNAVKNGTGISFLTHGIYESDELANTHYGITEETLRTFLDAIKEYVDNGKLQVLTYKEVYNLYY